MDRQNTTDLTNGGTVGIKVFVADEAHEGYKRFSYEQMRREFSEGLLDAIEKCRHPAVVEISEIEHPITFGGRPGIEIEIKARLTPVRYHNIEMVKEYTAISMHTKQPLSLRSRLKILITGTL